MEFSSVGHDGTGHWDTVSRWRREGVGQRGLYKAPVPSHPTTVSMGQIELSPGAILSR